MRLNELLDVIFRWAHLIAGIMWIGNSMLFNWLDRNLEKRPDQTPLSQGKIAMLHSGAFYDVEKKLYGAGETWTGKLHWFKWQNFATWATGISLLVVVYYMNGAAFLVDPNVMAMDPIVARTLSISSLFVGWLVYDGLWRTYGEHNPRVATILSVALLFAAIWGFAHVFSGRAAYIQTGVLVGTIMTGNVWLIIVPSQRELVAATKEGRAQDPTLSVRAKQRSIHNNYVTFPLLFIMLSNHFPTATGSHLNWLVLIAVMVGGAGVRHFMNTRYRGGGVELPTMAWIAPAIAMGCVAMVGLLAITRVQGDTGPVVDYPVPFSRAQEIIVKRCVPCHSAHPTEAQFPVAPNNIMFDNAATIRSLAPRIKARAVEQKTMPFLNRTEITDLERAEIGAWIDQGAELK
nr:urate hydroxylase PuuD [Kofleriaceae bacterium]